MIHNLFWKKDILPLFTFFFAFFVILLLPIISDTAVFALTPTVSSCDKSKGDANCDSQITLADYEIWRQEFLGEFTTKVADFNNDQQVNIRDFELWRRGFYAAGISPTPPTPSPAIVTTAPTLAPTQIPTPSLQPTISVTCTITGTAGNDNLTGTAGNDVICGLGGNDKIIGMGGNDRLDGGAGNDQILGGEGDDIIIGGSGFDQIAAQGGNDTLYAQDGEFDQGDGGAGTNTCFVDPGDQFVQCQ